MAQISDESRLAGIESPDRASALFDRAIRKCADPGFLSVCTLAVAAVCTIVAAASAVLVPAIRPVLLREDGIIESGSVALLGTAVLGCLVASLLWGPRAPLLIAGGIGLAELMDETSFGARLFGFQPPPLYGGGELDGFHDLLILAYRTLRDVNQGWAMAWIGVMLIASVGIMVFSLRQASVAIPGRNNWFTDHVLLFLHIGLIGLAQVIDVATNSRTMSAVEEMLEFNAALVLLFYIGQQSHRLYDRPLPTG